MDHDPFEQDPLERASFPLVRLVVAVLVSLLAHAGVWGSSFVFEPFPTGSFKINIDVRDNVKLMGLGMSSPKPEPPPEEAGPLEMVGVEPPPPPPPRKPKAIAVKKKSKPRKPKPQKPNTEQQRAENTQPPRFETDPNRRLGNAPAPAYIGDVPFEARDIPSVRSVAPGNAVASAIVDMRRVRNSPYKADIDKLLKSYPDYHRVIGAAGQDPMETYDRFLVATTNPAMISQTLLLGEVRQPEQLRSEVNRIAGEELTWSTAQGGVEIAQPDVVWWARRGNDPRVFVIPTTGVFALARRDQLAWFAARRQSARFFPAMPPPIDSERGALPAIVVAEFRLAPGSYGVDVAARLPMPSGASVALHDDRRPLIRVSLSFRSVDEADAFKREWPRVQEGLMNMLVIRVGPFRGLIGRVKAQKNGDTGVYLEVRGTPNETRRLLALVAHLIKSRTQYDHPRQDELPKPEPDKKEANQAGEGGLWGDQGGETSSKRGEKTLWGEPDANKDKASASPSDEKPSPSVGERLSKQLSGARDALKRPAEQEAAQEGGGLFGGAKESDALPQKSDAVDAKRASEDAVDTENAPNNPTTPPARDEADESGR